MSKLTSAARLLPLSLLLVAACDQAATREVVAAPPAVTAKPERTDERLMQRGRERWELIARADWISAYEFLSGDQRLRLTLSQYLNGKEIHKYASPTVERVLGQQGSLGYLSVRAFWTPDHPAMKSLPADQQGAALTQELPMVETWRWDGDDWYFLRAQDVDEFMAEHKDLAGR